jgi:GTP-binding protein
MKLRNIAIIAHVDHGKTTLIDVLLRQSGAFRDNQRVAERAMDSNDLERERGITILAKVTSIDWQGTRINIVDTPGHADFGGEVERILNMVDGAIVLVDAAEGPMPQTKFVVQKALKVGLRPIVAINKIDKPEERHAEVVNEVFDLFAALDASEEQLDFPVLYGSAKQGWMAPDPAGPRETMAPLFDLVLEHVSAPTIEDGPFRMLATTVEADPYLGRILTGRVSSGTVAPNQPIKALSREGKLIEQGRVSKVLAFRGLDRTPVDSAEAGDIIAIAGLSEATVADTLCAPEVSQAIPAQPIDPPTLSMTFRINDGPFAGQEGKKVQSRVIRERLLREAEGNVALRIGETEDKDAFEVSGRGELQLAILIETMRREGFELTVSRPRVVMQVDPQTGQRLEPIEEVIIDVDDDYSGAVVQKLSERRGELIDMRPSGGGRQRLILHVPTRGLIGYQGELLSDTRGTAVMNRLFHEYAPHRGDIQGRRTGVLLSNGQGEAVAYALWNLEDRGPLMIGPQTRVYQGMIIGEHSRGNDLEVNVLKGKQLTNIRAAGKDDAVKLTTPMKMTLERALSYIDDDELVEVTPQSIRLRKRYLDPHERKKAERAAS